MTTTHRPKVSLGLNKNNVPVLLGQAKAMYNGVKAHPENFPNPNPTLVVLLGLIADVDTAEQGMATRAPDAAAVRDKAVAALIIGVETEGHYIQEQADARPADSVAIIESANVHVAAAAGHEKGILVVKTTTPGAVALTANATMLTQGMGSAKVTFHWRHTPDHSVTWIESTSTPVAHTTISGLQPLIEHGFQVCAATADGPGEWSPVVYLLVK